jgi:hypothetical protein
MQNFSVDIGSFCDVIYIQEHLLLKQHLHQIDNYVPDFKGHYISGMSEYSSVIQCRSHGGCVYLA